MVKLAHTKGKVIIEGRFVEEVSDIEKDLIHSIPQVSLGSIFRTDAFPKGILVDSITSEKEETEYEKWYRERENINQE